MKTLFAVLSLIVITLGLCSVSFAATEYVIANDNNYINNHLTVYALDATNGTLAQVAVLMTGGNGFGTMVRLSNYSNIEQAVSPGAACIFALNSRSSDIAAFSKEVNYTLIGNYSNSALDSSADGGSLAVDPKGKYLYASYSKTGNIGLWQVNVDCSLTFLASYLPSGRGGVGAIKLTPSGSNLVVPFPDTISGVSAELFAVNSGTGTLTDLGYISFCSPTDCVMSGVDVTKDSRFAIFSVGYNFGNGLIPLAVVARITSQGLASPRWWSLQNPLNVEGPIMPFLSSAGYAGSGNLYFGSNNGVITTSFTESPLRVALTNETLVPPTSNSNGTIAVAGDILVMAEYPDQIGLFSINPNGSLGQLSTTAVQGSNLGMTSVTIFPVTR